MANSLNLLNHDAIYYYQTPAGVVTIKTQQSNITAACFEQQQADYSYPFLTDQELNKFSYLFHGTDLQVAVWQALLAIPRGNVVTYQEVAQCIGYPKAHRAVATAIGMNKIAYFIPCHRVIRKDGSLGGYRWGLDIKRRLLAHEGVKKSLWVVC
jgi:O-6-methylguanine DNA methyltransferase